MRHQSVYFLAAALLFTGHVAAFAEDPVLPPQPQLIQPKASDKAPAAWLTLTVPAGVNVTVVSGQVQIGLDSGEVVVTGPGRITVGGMELRIRGQTRVNGGKTGEATVVRMLKSLESVRLTLPASPDAAIMGKQVRHNTEAMRLETTGALTVKLPNGVTLQMREGKASSSTLRKGEPVELTLTQDGKS